MKLLVPVAIIAAAFGGLAYALAPESLPEAGPQPKQETYTVGDFDREMTAIVDKRTRFIRTCFIKYVGEHGEAHARAAMTPQPYYFSFIAPDTDELKACLLAALYGPYPKIPGFDSFSVFMDWKNGELALDAGYMRP